MYSASGVDAIYCVQCQTHPGGKAVGLADRIKCAYGLLTPKKCPPKSESCLTFVGKLPLGSEAMSEATLSEYLYHDMSSLFPIRNQLFLRDCFNYHNRFAVGSVIDSLRVMFSDEYCGLDGTHFMVNNL